MRTMVKSIRITRMNARDFSSLRLLFLSTLLQFAFRFSYLLGPKEFKTKKKQMIVKNIIDCIEI